MAATPIKLICFPGTGLLPLYAGIEKGGARRRPGR